MVKFGRFDSNVLASVHLELLVVGSLVSQKLLLLLKYYSVTLSINCEEKCLRTKAPNQEIQRAQVLKASIVSLINGLRNCFFAEQWDKA